MTVNDEKVFGFPKRNFSKRSKNFDWTLEKMRQILAAFSKSKFK